MHKTRSLLNLVFLYHTADEADTIDAIVLPQGSGLKVTGISSEIHVEDHEHRTFFWYHVQDLQDRSGWVRGFELATAFAASDLPDYLTRFDSLKLNYFRDFGNAKMWFAAVQTVKKDMTDDASFIEYYLVLGNESGKQLFYPIGVHHLQGQTETKEFYISDVNGDRNQDLLFVKRSKPTIGNTTYHLEIVTIMQGRFIRLLDKPLTLFDSRGDISPLQAMSVDIDNGTIRFESLVLENCETDDMDLQSVSQEDCLSFETNTIKWSNASHSFETLYQPVKIPVSAMLINAEKPVRVLAAPIEKASLVGYLSGQQKVKALKTFNAYPLSDGHKTRATWVFIQLNDGTRGYVEGKHLKWLYTKQDEIFRQWFRSTSLTVFEFEPSAVFLSIK